MIHSSQRTDARRAFIVLAVLLPGLLAAALLPGPLPGRGLAHYLPLHTTLEVLSIAVATLVFAIGWNTRRHQPSQAVLWLACLFLGVAALDLSHMLSYQGMPSFVTPSSPQKAIHFWLAARTLAAFALLGAALMAWRTRPPAAPALALLGVLLVVALLHGWFLYAPERLPATFVPGRGLTTFKIGYEYGLIVAYLLAAALYFRHLRRPREFNAGGLFATAGAMAMSEFFFTLYAEVSDLYNLLGHLYKIAAYALLYRALFIETVQRPYQQVLEYQRQLGATIDTLPDLLFELDADGNYVTVHANEPGKLAAPPSALLGRNVRDMLPPEQAEIVMNVLREAAQRRIVRGARITLQVPDGECHFELSVARKDNGTPNRPHFLLLSRDITAAVRHEQALAHEGRVSRALLGLTEVARGADEHTLLQHAADQAAELTGSPAALICLIDDDQHGIDSVAWSAATPEALRAASFDEHHSIGDVGRWADPFRRRQPVLIDDSRDAPGEPAAPGDATAGSGLTRMLGVPVLDGDTVRAIVDVGNKPARYDEHDRAALQRLADSLWQIIHRRRQAERLRQKQEELDHFFSANIDLFCIASSDGILLRINGSWEALLGYPIGELEGRPFLDFVHPDDREISLDTLGRLNRQPGRIGNVENRWIARDGSLRNMEWRAKAVGGVIYAAARDITERKQQDSTIRKLSSAVAQSPYPVLITDVDGRIEYSNEAFSLVSGYSADELAGQTPAMLKSGKTSRNVYKAMRKQLERGEPWKGEFINRRKDGSEYFSAALIYPVRDARGEIVNYLAHQEDVTARKAAAERLRQLSHYDQLTGLPNRVLLEERFRHAIDLARRHGESLTLMWLDIDHFKEVNDALGHSVGDLLLLEVAHRLRTQLRDQDTLSRHSGDDFVIVLPGTDQDDAAALATRLLGAIEAPLSLSEQELIVSSSIGIALFPNDADSLEGLQMCAEAAMYRMKQEGRNGFRFYAPEMQAHSARMLALGNALKHALSRAELSVEYQPQIDLASGRIVGAEALMRWHSPQWGQVSPAEFIPIAEDNGLIVPMGEWMLRTATEQLRRWHDAGLNELTVAVNLSAVQFAQPALAATITRLVEAAGVAPEHVDLELTEAVALKNPDAAMRTMVALSDAGFQLSIDDFGTGYSSMSYLKRFAVDKLKIDKSFIRELGADNDDQAIVTAIIQMAHSLGMTTIAEGVETDGQRSFLQQHGCDQIQGFLCSRPLPAEQFEAFVRGGGGG